MAEGGPADPRRDDARAAGVLADMGHVDEGYARLRAGEHDLAEGRVSEGEAQLRRAIEHFGRLGATRYVRRAKRLLAGAGLQVSA